MTTVTEPRAERKFVRDFQPRIVAAAALVFYLLSLNHWLSISGLPFAAHATGYTTEPDVYAPLFYLLTLPFRLLPESAAPAALNALSAVCGALTLGLLARIVALLPHDRTQFQRDRESSPFGLLAVRLAWVPPLLAVAVCGLQLTFWESATNVSKEIFDLLLFAYVVRCLLEFRIEERDAWLLRAAFLFAAGMAESWIFPAVFPAFLASVIWVKGKRFFRWRFVFRIFLLGALGLLCYLILPIIHLFADGAFWLPLKANLAMEKVWVASIFTAPHHIQLLLVLTSFLPLLMVSIRWQASFGDSSHIGGMFTTLMFHLSHAVFLAACVWMAFDPSFSLRHSGLAILPLYFLGAICIGYFSGYFLVVFQRSRQLDRRDERTPPLQKLLRKLCTTVVMGLLVLVPAGLLYKNIPSMRLSNGPNLLRFAALLTKDLPPHAALLSDEPNRLFLAESYFARSGRSKDYIYIDSHALKFPLYHELQRKKYSDWPVIPNLNTNSPVDDLDQVHWLANLAAAHPLYYLHPSFGSYFEYFYLRPHGLDYELKPFSTNTAVTPPPFTDSEIAQNEDFWKSADTAALQVILSGIVAPPPETAADLRTRLFHVLHIPFEPNVVAVTLGQYYARSLNDWGVIVQRQGRLDAAENHFNQAQKLAPDNVVAEINSDFNRRLRAGDPITVEKIPSLQDRFGKYHDWQEVINVNGSFDDPTYVVGEGVVFARGGLARQAAQQFQRVLELVPDNLLAQFWLARIYVSRQMVTQAQPLLESLESHPAELKKIDINPNDVLQLDYVNHIWAKEPQKADAMLKDAVAKNPGDADIFNLASRLSIRFGHYSNALDIVEKQLQPAPDDTNLLSLAVQLNIAMGNYSNALTFVEKELKIVTNEPTILVNQGYLELQLGNYDRALPPLNQALEIQPANYRALLNRAIVYLRSNKFDDAQRDYATLEKDADNIKKQSLDLFPVYYGLGDIAFHHHDTNAAIHYYTLYFSSNVPTNSDEAKLIRRRLDDLKADK